MYQLNNSNYSELAKTLYKLLSILSIKQLRKVVYNQSKHIKSIHFIKYIRCYKFNSHAMHIYCTRTSNTCYRSISKLHSPHKTHIICLHTNKAIKIQARYLKMSAICSTLTHLKCYQVLCKRLQYLGINCLHI